MPTPLDGALRSALARIRVRHALRALTAAAIAAAAALLVLRSLAAPAAVVAAGCAIAALAAGLLRFRAQRSDRTAAAAAAAFERADPSLRNVLITAQELIAAPDAAPTYMRARVLAEAERRASSLDPGKVLPIRRDGAAALAAIGLVALVLVIPLRPPAGGRQAAKPGEREIGTSRDFEIDIVPPSYTGRPAVHLKNPGSLDALAGSQALIRVPSGGKADIRLNGTAIRATPDGAARAVLSASGYLAIDAGLVHRLLPLSVTPDRAPDVRITAPAKDMRIATTAVSIPIAAEAVDDIALGSFELRYTVVSGAGEQFSFTEGTMPATLVRGSDRSWRLETILSPARMKLEPGDVLIYRAVAADRRPGDSGAASSDTFFVEIAGPGDVALAGVEMPPDKERYALSEAMIVLKIERLQARETSMARAALEEAAGAIVAEQRAVRANFIFLLGGEIQDENVEAETSSEIAEGRFANKARQEIVAATILMGRVERALTAVSTREALPLAREAVRALQRAFGHSRYLLRALPARARLDPARRLSGDLASAADWNRALAPPASDPQVEAARSALMDLIAVTRALDQPPPRAEALTRLSRLAERILTMPGAAADLQAAGRLVLTAREAVEAGQIEAARGALQRAAAPLVARAQRGRIEGSAQPRDPARLAGAAAVLSGDGHPVRRGPGGGTR
jgi:hypothetical protein